MSADPRIITKRTPLITHAVTVGISGWISSSGATGGITKVQNIVSGWVSGTTGRGKIQSIVSGWVSGATGVIKSNTLDANTTSKKSAFRSKIGAGSGTITAVTTSSGLSGGGTAGSVTLKIPRSGIQPNMLDVRTNLNKLAFRTQIGASSGGITSVTTTGGVLSSATSTGAVTITLTSGTINNIVSGWVNSSGGIDDIETIVSDWLADSSRTGGERVIYSSVRDSIDFNRGVASSLNDFFNDQGYDTIYGIAEAAIRANT